MPVSLYLGGRKVGENLAGDGGRAAVTVSSPAGRPPVFTVKTGGSGRHLIATGRIFYWHTGQVIIAVDIDNTISRTDYDKLLLTNIPQKSPPVPGARDTLDALSRHYNILYLTARPHFLLEKTRYWLGTYRFPAGPVVTAPRLKDAARPARWKARALDGLRVRWPDLLIGIGNHNADAAAYAYNNMLPVIIYTTGEELHYSNEVVLQDWKNIAEFFKVNREKLSDPSILRKVVEGKKWLLQPIIPWQEAAASPRQKPRPESVLERLLGPR